MNKKILKFHAVWCSPCKQLTNMIAGIEESYPVEAIDIDGASDELLTKFGIRGVPVLAVVNVEEDGEYTLLGKKTGLVTKDQLKEFADSL